ncbi:MAG: Gldg family protein [Planctomycetales bacterium]
MLKCHVILAVTKRNVASYFSGVLGYLFIVVFVLAAAALAFTPQFFANNLANLDQLNAVFPMLLLFLVPAITMGVWADEKKQGTDEILFTLPARDVEILLGKYFAVLIVYSVALLFSLSQLFVLAYYADPDPRLLATTYLGYWLSGAALLSAGMFASSLTRNATVAFILGVVICAVPVFVGELPSLAAATAPFIPGFLQPAADSLGRAMPSREFFAQLSLSEQFREFGMGLVPLAGLLYFGALTAFMLYLNLIVITHRHWSSRQKAKMGLQFLVRAVSVAIVLICLNFVVRQVGNVHDLRADMTAESLYTLSPTTKELVRNIDEKSPVVIDAYFSPDVPPDLVVHKKNLTGLLRQYDALGGGRLEVNVFDVEPFSEKAAEAGVHGIVPRRVQFQRGGRIQVEDVYLGAVIRSPNDRLVVPFFEVGIPVEYELTRSVRTVAQRKRLHVAFLRTDAEVGGGMDFQSFTRSPQWRIKTELEKQYAVGEVSPDRPLDEQRELFTIEAGIAAELDARKLPAALRERFQKSEEPISEQAEIEPVEKGRKWRITDRPEGGRGRTYVVKGDDPASPPETGDEPQNAKLTVYGLYDVVIAVLPSSLTQPQMTNFVEYVKTGRPVLIFDDPVPMSLGLQLAPRQPKPRPGGMFGQMGPPPETKADNGEATTLLSALGIAWDNGEIVWDDAAPHPQFADLIDPENVFITAGNNASDSSFNQSSPITSGLQEILAIYPGRVREREGSKTNFSPLLYTSAKSGVNDWESLVEMRGFNQVALVMDPNRKPDRYNHVIAAHITSDGKRTSPLDVVYVADLDLISNAIFQIVENDAYDLKLDNVRFVLNAVDVLAGDEAYLDLRKRRQQHRTLTRLEDRIGEFREQRRADEQNARTTAEQQIKATEERFQKRKKAIEDDPELSELEKRQKIGIAVEDERRRLAVARSNVEREMREKIEKLKAEEQREIRNLEGRIRFWAVGLPALPALFLGVLVWGVRLAQERSEVDPRRSVK